MKILNVKQVQQTDAYTIKHEPIDSIDLMERASRKFVEAFSKSYNISQHIAIVCGPGNNGGDGLAVTRLLLEKGYPVQPMIVRPKDGGSQDFIINAERLKDRHILTIKQEKEIPDFSKYNVVIDAIFGSGLTRPITGLFAKVIEAVNKQARLIVSIDIPSGLFMDEPAPDGAIIQARHTISFQLPKLAFFFPENYPFVGDWQLVDIGLDKEFIAIQDTTYYALDKGLVKTFLPKRTKFDHKGSYGHVQLIGGSYGKIGAMVLATEAAMFSGAGLVSVNIPRCGRQILQSALPEAMLIEQIGENEIEKFNVIEKANALGIGPGLGIKKQTMDAFGKFLRNNIQALVIDADGINILAQHREYLELLPLNTILTPHLKEFDRLAGDSFNNWQRLDKARSISQKLNIIIVLKGAHSAIIEPEGTISFNTTGNHGMATGGSGDVLLGLITGLLAQGVAAAEAAKLGVYLHGLAGDLACSFSSPRSLVASDITSFLGEAFLDLER